MQNWWTITNSTSSTSLTNILTVNGATSLAGTTLWSVPAQPQKRGLNALLQDLREAGELGLSSFQVQSLVGNRYAARIHELRKGGHKIKTERQGGTFRYILEK